MSKSVNVGVIGLGGRGYNMLCGAWGSVIGNVLMVASILTAMYRHDRNQ